MILYLGECADKETPRAGIVIKMSSGPKLNCSLSVSVICDANEVQVRAGSVSYLITFVPW